MQTNCDVKVLPGQALVDSNGVEILNTIKAPRYLRYMDYVIGKLFTDFAAKQGWTVADLGEPENFRQLYKHARTYMGRDLINRNISKDSSTYTDIAKIILNWDLFTAYHNSHNAIVDASNEDLKVEEAQDSGTKANSTADEAEDGDIDENDENEEFDNPGNKDRPLDLASSNIKMLVRILAKASVTSSTGGDIEVAESVESDGLPISADFSSLFNNLALRLAGRKNWEDFFGALQSPELIKIFPEVKQLNKILNLSGEMTKKQVVQVQEFYKIFSRPEIKLYLSKVFTNNSINTFNFFPQLRGNRDKIKSTFKGNFPAQNIPEHLKQYVTIDGVFSSPRISSLPEPGISDTSIDISNIDIQKDFRPELDLLSLIGINLTGIPLITTIKEKEKFVTLLKRVRDDLYPNIKNRLEAGQEIRNPIDDLGVSLSGIRANKKILTAFINLESWYSTIAPSIMTTNSKGEPQSDISNDNAISVSLYHLNSVRFLDDVYSTPSYNKAFYSPLFKKSKTLKFLFAPDGSRIEANRLDVINYNGFQYGDEKAKVTRDMSDTDKLMMDLNNLLQSGTKDILRTSTANSFYALRRSTDGESQIYYPVNSFSGNFKNNASFKADILNYLDAEVTRIKQYNEDPSKYSTTPSYGDWSIFSEVLKGRDELKSKLLSSIQGNEEEFMDAVEDYFNSNILDLKNLFSTSGRELKDFISDNVLYTRDDKGNIQSEASIDDIFRSFLANSFTTDVEFTAIISGEPIFYKDMNKRLKALASTGNIASSTKYVNDFLNKNITEQKWKEKYSLASTLDTKHRSNNKNYQTQVIQEDKSTQNAYTSPEMRESLRNSIKLRDNKIISEEELDRILEGTDNVKTSDGQGYVSLDFHRELSFRFGFWTPNLEIAYEYQGLYFKKLKVGLNSKEDLELQSLRNKVYSNPEKYAIPVLKVTHFGNIENKDVLVDAKSYDKFSIAPLLPEFTNNHPKLQALSDAMIKNQTGYVKYESGTKLFVRKSVPLEEVGIDPDLQATELLKEQLKTKIDQKVESSLPTQFVKLVMSNLFNEGKAITEKASKLYSDYLSLLTSIQKEQQLKLLDDLGFSYNYVNDKPQITSFNPNKIREMVEREVARQSLPSSVLDALQVVNNNGVTTFKYSPEASGAYQIISDLVSGIADDTLRRYPLNSADFVLISSSHIKDKLKFFKYSQDGTRGCECKIALTRAFIPLLNKLHPDTNQPINSLETLNKLLKNPEWVKENEKALTVVFSRPPVQGPNSMGFATVQEFLPPTMGNTLILPDEFVAKAGIDFDYDKEKVLLPQLTRDGVFISQSEHDKIVSRIKELENEYPELRESAAFFSEEKETDIDNFVGSLFKLKQPPSEYLDFNKAVVSNDNAAYRAYQEYTSLTNYNKYSTTNRFLELYADILKLPELFADLVTPNATGLVKPLALNNSTDLNRVGEDKPVDSTGSVKLPALGKAYEYLEQLKIFKTFFNSKELLGGFAVDNTFQQLYTQNNLQLNTDYLDGRTIRRINLMLFSPKEKEEIMRDGKITMAKRFNSIDSLIQHLNSEFINSTVDAEKDPYFAELNIVWENIGVYNMLKDMGLNPEVAIDFINTPVIRQYLKYRKMYNNKTLGLGHVLADLGVGTKMEKEVTTLYNMKERGITHNYSAVGKVPQSNPKFPFTGKVWFPITEKQTYIAPFTYKDSYPYLNQRDRINDKYVSPTRLKELKIEDNPIMSKEENLDILANFVEFEKHAQQLRSLQQLFNYDTRKISSPLEVDAKNKLRDKIVNAKMITSESLNRFETNSIVSKFDNKDLISSIFSNVFTITNSGVVKSGLSELYNAYSTSFGRNKALLRVMPKTLNNELLRAIVDNLGEYDGQSILDYSTDLLAKFNQTVKQNITLVERLANFRKLPLYKDLVKQYPILSRFTPDIATESSMEGIYRTVTDGKVAAAVPHNLRFVRNSSDVISEVEGYIQQMRELLSPDLKVDQKEKVQNLIKDILIAGYFQSGFSKTYMGYNDIIPPEFLLQIIPNAMNKFQNLSPEEKRSFMVQYKNNPNGGFDLTGGFLYQFQRNNSQYFPALGQKDAIRGKNYRITTSVPEETVTQSDTQSKQENKPTGSVKDIGQYVQFQGETYIVTQINKNGTIQIYNPTREGTEAKKSVAERNLIPVNAKAKIVDYKDAQYIVTPKNTIISLTTNKIMNWDNTNGDRKAILGIEDNPNFDTDSQLPNVKLDQPLQDC